MGDPPGLRKLDRMNVLLVSTYELGHQPLQLASPASMLSNAGHAVRAFDLSVEDWDDDALSWADAVAFSVPMHTATRLAIRAANHVGSSNPDMPMCFYGLYAMAGASGMASSAPTKAIAGEYEPKLLEWIETLSVFGPSRESNGIEIDLGRHEYQVPTRSGLPQLDRYAHLANGDEHRLVGYVEASHGCIHRCTHCPVPVIYDGRIRIVDAETVLDDIAHLSEMGAEHITFGDPDFLNGLGHSLRIVRAMHDRFPALTFDCTAKVEHIVRHRGIWPEFAEAGCIFVVSAFESMNDDILAKLDKGHTAQDAAECVEVLRRNGIEPRPSLLPFTPWTTFADLFDILDFVSSHELIENVDPIQYAIRLLLPQGSLLLDDPDLKPYIGDYDSEGLAYGWHSADPRLDTLQKRLSKVVEERSKTDETAIESFTRIVDEVAAAAGVRRRAARPHAAATQRITPRLTESWFC